MEERVDELEEEVQHFEARPDKSKAGELLERLDDLMLEDGLSSAGRKRAKELRTRVGALDFNKPTNQHLLTKEEIFARQKKLLYDCEKIGMNVSEELGRQNGRLEDSRSKVMRIDGKLVSSAGLLLTIKRNIRKNTIMLRVVVFVLILVFLVILLMKVFG